MNELKRKILQSDFYKNIYNNRNSQSIELSVSSLEHGMQEAAAIFQCPIYELTYKVLEEGNKGFFNIGSKPYLVRYTRIVYERSNIGVGDSINYNYGDISDANNKPVIVSKDT